MAWFTKWVVASLYSTIVVMTHGMLLQAGIVWGWSFNFEWSHEGHLNQEYQCMGHPWQEEYPCLGAGWIMAGWQRCWKEIWDWYLAEYSASFWFVVVLWCGFCGCFLFCFVWVFFSCCQQSMLHYTGRSVASRLEEVVVPLYSVLVRYAWSIFLGIGAFVLFPGLRRMWGNWSVLRSWDG